MADQTHVTASITVDANPSVANVRPFPSDRQLPGGHPQADELAAIAEDLERIVDARSHRLRRVADVLASIAALLVLSPVMLLVAIAIKLDSPGPVFYKQDRIGINRRRSERRRGPRAGAERRKFIHAGKPFAIWKFRTMRQDAEAAGPQWARAVDPRVTRAGRVLRKSRLDEVPQFVNVLRGEMTLIGPRPERSFFIKILEAEIPHYSKRLLVKPGITGLAQVNNGYDDSVESVRRKVAWDLCYIRKQDARTHFDIVAKTVRTVVTGDGAC